MNARFGFVKQRRTTANSNPIERKAESATSNLPKRSELMEGNKYSTLSSADLSVLRVFETYLMTPGKMLCFNSQDQEAYQLPLANLTNLGMISPEQMKGGYSLTQIGYAAMRDGK